MNDNEMTNQERIKPSITHKDIAEALGVSVATIKHYRSKFPEFLPPLIQAKPLRFEPDVIKVCQVIRNAFTNGLSTQEIRSQLYKKFTPSNEREARGGNAKSRGHAQNPYAPEAVEHFMKEVAGRFNEMMEKHAEVSASLAKIAAMLEGRMTEQPAGGFEFEKLLDRLEKAVSARPLSFPPVRKIIRVRNNYGDEQEYVFDLETNYKIVSGAANRSGEVPQGTPKAKRPSENPGRVSGRGSGPRERTEPPLVHNVPAPPPVVSGDAEKVPAEHFLSLPLVIMSSQGDFLGAAGKAHGTFTVGAFQELLKNNSPASGVTGGFALNWEPRTDGWILHTRQAQASGAKTYDMHIIRTTTPKGNDVALVQKLYLDTRLVPTVHLYTFIKQLSASAARNN